MLRSFQTILFASLLAGIFTGVHAQSDLSGLKVFGYFQISLEHQKSLNRPYEANSFSVQQLNLFLQRDILQKWTAFVNFELVNSYSSFRNWGAFSVEEAWVNYRASKQFKLKLGLQVPTFNNLNEIKNRTPLLPYIIRPLAYEASFNEVISIYEYVPTRAFVQAYGFIPWREKKLDYALFIGDSPNINRDPLYGQTGVDTTKSFLVGGRFGLRSTNLKAGVSAAFDAFDLHAAAGTPGYAVADFNSVPRFRFGGDFSFLLGKLSWESEFIRVFYDDDYPEIDLDKDFYYGTLGYQFAERLFAYAGYWVTHEKVLPARDRKLIAPTLGLAYNFNDTIFLKAQAGRPQFKFTVPAVQQEKVYYYFLAVSAMF